MSYKLLNELTDGSELWKIVVRVHRRWNLYDKTAPDELFFVTMVLLDEEVFDDLFCLSCSFSQYMLA